VPSATITPQPTPVYARVFSEKFGGALVRSEPDGAAITTIQNGILVQVLPEVEYYNGAVWVKIIAIIGPSTIEGWVIQSLLVTATPAANWAPTATPTATASVTP
jgi:hypothetical protein